MDCRVNADNEPRPRFTETTGWLAAMSYASGYKRLGRQHLLVLFAALTMNPRAEVVVSGRLPAVRSSTGNLQ